MGCLRLIIQISIWLLAVWFAWGQVDVHNFWSAVLFIVVAGFMYVLIHIVLGGILTLIGAILAAIFD